jgi:integrating conjugative element membrane protein (TIGR03745 family)
MAAAMLVGPAFAALPKPTPISGIDNNDWLKVFEAYAGQGAALAGKILAVGIMLYLGAHAIADLNDVRKGDKEWHEIGFGTVVGALIFLVVTYILTQIDGVLVTK